MRGYGVSVKRLFAPAVLALLWVPGTSAGQSADFARANYTKFEYRIPMRDGVKLFTSVYVPKDAGEKYPILLTRTPYSVAPYGPDAYKSSLGPSDRFMRDGYIFVYQDVRGRMMSEGQFVDVRPHRPVKSGPSDIDESTDTYDTIAWLLENVPNHNGRVGLYGISYPGFYTSAGMIDAHPALGSSATTFTTTARCTCRTPSGSLPGSGSRGRNRRPASASASTTAPTTGTSSTSSWARCRT